MTVGGSYIIKTRSRYFSVQKITLIEQTELTYLIDFETKEHLERVLKADFNRTYRIIEILEPESTETESNE